VIELMPDDGLAWNFPPPFVEDPAGVSPIS